VKQISALLKVMMVIIWITSTGQARAESTGKVDWVNGYISGFGIGLAEPGTNRGIARTSSIRAAKVDALRNLVGTIHQMHIDPGIRVEDYITSTNAAGTRVRGLIKGARMVDHKTQWLDDSPLTIVEMRVCISTLGRGCSNNDSLISALDLVSFTGSHGSERGMRSGAASSGTIYRGKPSDPVTGIVFSLGGLPYRRVILPIVAAMREDRLETVYAAHFVEPATVRSRGIVCFTDTLEQAKEIDRIGGNYLVVPVERVTVDNTLMIGPDSARSIYETSGEDDYLRHARVVISAE